MKKVYFFISFCVAFSIGIDTTSYMPSTSSLNTTEDSGTLSTEYTTEMSGSGDEPPSSTDSSKATTTSATRNGCYSELCPDPIEYCEIVNEVPTCSSRPGYFCNSSSTCTKAMELGGLLYLASATRILREVSNKEKDVNNFLKDVYGPSEGFLAVDVINEDPSDVWNYKLIYDVNSGVDPSSTLEMYLTNDLKSNCTNDICTIPLFSSLRIMKNKSVENAGNADSVVCQSYNTYCDDSSTNCVVNEGLASCDCKPHYVTVFGSDRVCAVELCNSNANCNSPFGWCDPKADDDVGKCTCMFGFEGDHCKSPWLFVFIIVAGFLALVLLSFTICMCVTSNKKSSKKFNAYSEDHTMENPYTQIDMNLNGTTMNGKMRASVPKELNFDDRYETSPSI